MNEEKLLTLAAKFIGYEYTGDGYVRKKITESNYINMPWNPLYVDSDAFRLYVDAASNITFEFYVDECKYANFRRALVECVANLELKKQRKNNAIS